MYTISWLRNKNTRYSTICPTQRIESLMELKNDSTIIIKPADKGGALVIQNIADYEKQILRQLRDDSFYKILPKDPTNQFKSLIHDKLSKFLNEGEITKTEYEHIKLTPQPHSMTPPIPGRPIVSSNGSLTENISTFVDHFVKPWAISLPTYT
ncbi:unnamed protein product [Coregonus sp. 'balchen']|nr:unnamed protein product [Coregonus sp. 'balchen']